jgi:hypothetical protein
MFIFDHYGGTENESWNQRKNRPGGCSQPGIGTGMRATAGCRAVSRGHLRPRRSQCSKSRRRDCGPNRLLEEVRQTLGDPAILVTNAGGPPPGTFASTDLAEYEKALNLNLMSAVHLIHGVTPAMKAKGWGRIIAVTSISVKQPIGNLLLSNMARAGLTGFLKTIATELAPLGITVR